jgi:hypothetical protein
VKARTIFLFVIAFGTAIYACKPMPPRTYEPTDGGSFPPGDTEPTDAEDPPEGSATHPACVRACVKLKELGCPEHVRKPGGKTCYRVCVDAVEAMLDLEPTCVVKARSVEEVRACGVRCRTLVE